MASIQKIIIFYSVHELDYQLIQHLVREKSTQEVTDIKIFFFLFCFYCISIQNIQTFVTNLSGTGINVRLGSIGREMCCLNLLIINGTSFFLCKHEFPKKAHAG